MTFFLTYTYYVHAEHAGKPVRAGSNDGSTIVSNSEGHNESALVHILRRMSCIFICHRMAVSILISPLFYRCCPGH